MKEEDRYTGWRYVYGKGLGLPKFIYLKDGKEVVNFIPKEK